MAAIVLADDSATNFAPRCFRNRAFSQGLSGRAGLLNMIRNQLNLRPGDDLLGDALISAIGTSVQKKTPASTNSATRSGFRLDRPARPQFFG